MCPFAGPLHGQGPKYVWSPLLGLLRRPFQLLCDVRHWFIVLIATGLSISAFMEPVLLLGRSRKEHRVRLRFKGSLYLSQSFYNYWYYREFPNRISQSATYCLLTVGNIFKCPIQALKALYHNRIGPFASVNIYFHLFEMIIERNSMANIG